MSSLDAKRPYGVVLARVLAPHEDLGEDTYHEWVTTDERVRADCLGRSNPRMWSASWVKWVCNNTSCAAFAFVSDEAALQVIREAEESL